MPRKTYPDLVLAVAPMARGFAFILFEGPLAPFDWGLSFSEGHAKNARTLEGVRAIIERYQPNTLVLEDCTSKSVRRSPRIRALALALAHLAAANHMEVHKVDRSMIRNAFATVGARTKYEIAQAIAREIPALSHRLPPLRKVWMSENPRQSLFDAAALAATYYAGSSPGQPRST